MIKLLPLLESHYSFVWKEELGTNEARWTTIEGMWKLWVYGSGDLQYLRLSFSPMGDRDTIQAARMYVQADLESLNIDMTKIVLKDIFYLQEKIINGRR